ncbi:hypothetical protein [Sorangium sp. So ce1097]|uniref:hypothetical protein n=1 Tax=Sorangium sp. So ce1097 TaxID=3133330 RepID=UPI003F5F4DF7
MALEGTRWSPGRNCGKLMQGGRPDAMGDVKKDLQGLRVGDFQVGAVPVGGTSDALDTEANRERARRDEEDKRAAQFGGSVEGAGEDAAEPAEEAMAAVDASIREARARLKSGEEDEEVPILLRDPVTGATIKHR